MKLALSKKYEMLRLRIQKCLASYVLKEPMKMVQNRYLLVDKYIKTLENTIQVKEQKEKNRYVALVAKLDTLSPLKTLTRGYAIIERNGKMVKSVKDLKKGDEFDLKLVDGSKKAVIEK